MPTRRSAEHVYALLEEEVLPAITAVKQDVGEVRKTLKNAGLDNGHASEVKLFFDQRAKRQAALSYLNDFFQPVARFKAVAYLIGVVATAGWAFMAVGSVLQYIHHPH